MNLDENKGQQLMEAVLKMHRLEEEKKQAVSAYNAEINTQKEWVYKLAEQMKQNQPTLFDGVSIEVGDDPKEPQDADFKVLEEPPSMIGGEVVDPETGEVIKNGAHGKPVPGTDEDLDAAVPDEDFNLPPADDTEKESEGTGEPMEEQPRAKQDHCKDCPSTYDPASTICLSCPHCPGNATNQQDAEEYTVGDEF